MREFTKKYIVITGASSGIGRETAKAFARRGRDLILTARSGDRLGQLQQEILQDDPSLSVIIRTADLAIPGEAQKLYADLQEYPLETWINNAGRGLYDSVGSQEVKVVEPLLRLDIEALTILSTFFVRDHAYTAGTQLINVSSAGGYVLVPQAVTYCAAKFYVSAFTEGLAWELKSRNALLQAKVLAPAATKTAFGRTANGTDVYDYDKAFGIYHTAQEMAAFLLALYDSDKTVGLVDRETFSFALRDPLLPYAGASSRNQKQKWGVK